jgi:small Trp-rich protein
MYLILFIVALSALRFFEVSVFAELSWWWVIALVTVAILWFEFIEKFLGMDKRREHDALEKARDERVKRTFDKDKR